MIDFAKKKNGASFPRAKISHAVEGVLRGKPFQIRVSDSKIGKMKIVHVLTPAWKSLRASARIEKVLPATALTQKEQKGILWLSVRTPDEYQHIVLGRPANDKIADVS